MRFDLQAHSVHSDGTLSATEVVKRAGAAGVQLLALSDHDTIDGVPEAVAAGAERGVLVVPAVELTALDADREDLHILGYGIDLGSALLRERLRAFQADREARGARMLEALRELGFALDLTGIERQQATGGSIGRPHVAAAVVSHRDNTERLRAEGISNATELLRKYLVPNTPAYRGRTTPTVGIAIETIHAAGGVAVWAHPFWDVPDPAAVVAHIDRFQTMGLDGVEVFYTTHTPQQVALLAQTCTERGLMSTGSSDFHGPEHPIFSRFLSHQMYGREADLGPIAEMAHRAAASSQL